MASFLGALNRLLPFASPGTPLLQDLLHLSALCILLYFAPQIQQQLQNWRAKHGIDEIAETAHDEAPVIENAVHEDIGNQEIGHGREAENIVDDVVDEERNLHPTHDLAADDALPGPANGAPLPPARNVGAKKAKSLARKDQRRAYHEFMRSQGDAQRAKDAEGAEERDAALAAEKERRKLTEKELESRKAKEREARKRQEELERIENARRTELILATVRDELDSRRMCDLFRVARMVGDDVDEEWVERVVKASGIVEKNGDGMVMITEMGWAVRITMDDMAAIYATALADGLGDSHGQISHEQLGALLETHLKQQSGFQR